VTDPSSFSIPASCSAERAAVGFGGKLPLKEAVAPFGPSCACAAAAHRERKRKHFIENLKRRHMQFLTVSCVQFNLSVNSMTVGVLASCGIREQFA
jgi:hypothetical protein